MRQIRILFDIKNSLRPLVLHVYIHFRVFTMHIHALLCFILTTMCEAGGNKYSYYSQYFFRQNDYDPPLKMSMSKCPWLHWSPSQAVYLESHVLPTLAAPVPLLVWHLNQAKVHGSPEGGNRANQILTAPVSLLN